MLGTPQTHVHLYLLKASSALSGVKKSITTIVMLNIKKEFRAKTLP